MTELQWLLTTPLLKAARRADYVQCHHSSRFHGFSFYLPHKAIYPIARNCQTRNASCALRALAEPGAAAKSQGPRARPGLWCAEPQRQQQRLHDRKAAAHTAARCPPGGSRPPFPSGEPEQGNEGESMGPACPWTVLCRGRHGRHPIAMPTEGPTVAGGSIPTLEAATMDGLPAGSPVSI